MKHLSTTITDLLAWEALDSRGNPTVGCEVRLAGGASGDATVPSGASTGTFEAKELRDNEDRYAGKGVRSAVRSVLGPFRDAIVGLDATDQGVVDRSLGEADGTHGFQMLGSNAALSVSIASAIAAASAAGRPLYRHLLGDDATAMLPLPMVNIISGGAHAGRALDIQDLLAVPLSANSFSEAVEFAWRVRRGTAEAFLARGMQTALIADEGGLAGPLPSNRAAFELIQEGIDRADLLPGVDVGIAVDVAATQFLDEDGRYRLDLEGRTLDAAELVDEIAGWCKDFAVVSVEDALADGDWDGWALASERLGGIQLLGDDLFVTDTVRLAQGISDRVANAVLVKPNQTGTLSGALAVVQQANDAGYRTVLSARSGETEDTWLADLSVGWTTGQIKVGSTMRSERTAKWNRLLKIEAELGDRTTFAGAGALRLA